MLSAPSIATNLRVVLGTPSITIHHDQKKGLFQEYKIGVKIGKITTIHHINRIKWENHDKEKSSDKL